MTTLRVARVRPSFVCILVLCAALSACTSPEKNGDGEDSSGNEQAVDESAPANDTLSQDLANEELGATAAPTAEQPAPPVTSTGDTQELSLDSEVSASQAAAEPVAQPVAEQAPSSEPAMQGAPSNDSSATVNVTDIRYVSRDGGSVVIDTSGPAAYHTREEPSRNQVVIEIANANLPEKLKRPYITKDFGQKITSVNAYQDRGSSTVRVVAQFREPTGMNIRQSGNALVMVPSGASQGEPSTEIADVATQPTENAAADDARILPASSNDGANLDSVRFYGRPISIEVRDTNIRDVINLIAEQSGANIVVANDVDGNVSLKLRQIPWDQALLIVMKTRNLGYVRQGSILRIAPYDSLQRETESARKVVEAQKLAEHLRVKVIPVGYAKVDSLHAQITPFLTKDRGRVVADMRTNSLVVTDTPEVLERIANLVKALDTPPLQVLIEGKVVEARETFARDTGINWTLNSTDVDIGNGRLARNGLTINNGGQNALGMNSNFQMGTFDVLGDLTAALALYEKEDQVNIVSSPRVVALNNEQATILQKTQLPLTTTTTLNGQTTVSTSYKDIEMKLDVTPQVTSENDIILNLNIKREFPSERIGDQAPAINNREAKTKVLVRNGQTAVVGGVYQSDTGDSEVGVPWLRHIPVLGWLFKKKSIRNEKSELLVFLTPRILNAETSMPKGGSIQ